MKVVINKCFGGFSVSRKVYEEMGVPWDGYGYDFNNERTNEALIKVVEGLGKDANGSCAKLKIIEVPDGVEFEIDDYDGMESVHEVHRSWE